MSKHKYTRAVCIAVVIMMLSITVLFMMGESLGVTVVHADMPYAKKLFSTDRVHTLDIAVDASGWQSMLDNASKKEYLPCNVVIDGDAIKNVGIRTKGNSTLSMIASSDSDRYSFKLEFDHYNDAQTYYGLDKLALNNIAQDSTYLKDYLSYRMMERFGADAPLCSFINITVNGEAWGLYLAVEGIEEAFARRNYGSGYGELYKPDSMDMNASRGGAPDETSQNMPGPQNGQTPAPPQDRQTPAPPQEGQTPAPPQDGQPPAPPQEEQTPVPPQDGQKREPPQGGQQAGRIAPHGPTRKTAPIRTAPCQTPGKDLAAWGAAWEAGAMTSPLSIPTMHTKAIGIYLTMPSSILPTRIRTA